MTARRARAPAAATRDAAPDSGRRSSACRSRPAGNVAGAGGKGVVVPDVDADGPAAERGFKTGDVILEVGGKSRRRASRCAQCAREARTEGKRTVLLRVKSGEATRFVAIPVGRA